MTFESYSVDSIMLLSVQKNCQKLSLFRVLYNGQYIKVIIG